MTAATLHLAAPTAPERMLLSIAASITAFVERRRLRRIERRELALDLLREQQTRKQDPRAVDIALLAIGSRPRD